MIENDPFEDFKRQRQIEFLEKKFTNKAQVSGQQLGDMVRMGKDKTELAARIESEMRDFFNESQDQVSRAIQESDTADTEEELEEKVHEEMADFFRLSSEKATDILDSIEAQADAGDVADQMVDHLRNVFQQGIAHIADVKERYGVAEDPPEASDPDGMAPPQGTGGALRPVSHNHSLKLGKPKRAIDGGPPNAGGSTPGALPPKLVQGMGPEPVADATGDVDGLDGDDGGVTRILKRQNHLPGAGRKREISAIALAELQALKALLLDKGIITNEELEDYLGRDR